MEIKRKYYKSSEWKQSGLPIIRIQNLKSEEASFNYYQGELDEKHRVAHGELLFAWSGTPGTSFGAHIGRGGEAALNQHIFKIAFDDTLIDKKFFCYALNQNVARYVEQAHGGVGLAHITKKKFDDSHLPLPPLNEQRRIVAKLEALFSELEAGTERPHTARAQLKTYRQSVLYKVFSGIQHSQARLETALKYVTSGSRGWAKFYSDSGDLFIRAQNLKFDRLDLSDCAFVSLPNKTEGTRTRVEMGDLLITITGANVTKSAIVEADLGTAFVSQHVALCRPLESSFPKFLYWYIVSESLGRKQLNSAAYGAGKPGLNLDNIKSVMIRLPTYEEQVRIVEEIEEKLSLIDDLERTIDTELHKAESLRQSILKAAFAGKLAAQNPTDEPASTLLARIREQKAAEKPAKKTKKRVA